MIGRSVHQLLTPLLSVTLDQGPTGCAWSAGGLLADGADRVAYRRCWLRVQRPCFAATSRSHNEPFSKGGRLIRADSFYFERGFLSASMARSDQSPKSRRSKTFKKPMKISHSREQELPGEHRKEDDHKQLFFGSGNGSRKEF